MNQAHVSEKKKRTVSEFSSELKKYEVIGLLNMENLPAQQLQQMRQQLRGRARIIMTKNRLLKIIFNNLSKEKPGIEKLSDHRVGMPALLLSNENPFKLYSILQKSKSMAPAKPGQKAPENIIVPAGQTQFAPGPIISELSAIGLKTGVEAGKIVIKEDKCVIYSGDTFSDKLAGALAKLDIKPIEIGLELVAAYESGSIYPKKVLGINEEQLVSDMRLASLQAFSLAIAAKIMTKDTAEYMIVKAFSDARALAVAQNIVTSETVANVLAKAEAEMQSVKSKANI